MRVWDALTWSRRVEASFTASGAAEVAERRYGMDRRSFLQVAAGFAASMGLAAMPLT